MALGCIGACSSTEIVNNIASFWRRTITKFVTKVIAIHTMNARTLLIWMPYFTAAFRAITVIVRRTRWSPVSVQKTAKNWQEYRNSFHTAQAPPLCIYMHFIYTWRGCAVRLTTTLEKGTINPLPPQSNNDEDAKEQKRAILASLKWEEEGWSRYSIYFVQECSMSAQDEPNLALWLATRAGKMKLSCPLGIRALYRKENLSFWCFIPYKKSFIDQACSVKMAGYWPRYFFACLWTETQKMTEK